MHLPFGGTKLYVTVKENVSILQLVWNARMSLKTNILCLWLQGWLDSC